MIHEAVLTLTENAFGSHPRCVVSICYGSISPFHGDSTDHVAGIDVVLLDTTRVDVYLTCYLRIAAGDVSGRRPAFVQAPSDQALELER
jgi:hypothetical protein